MGDYNYKGVDIPANANSKTASSNAGVLTNDNGNTNTAGVKSINGNKNANRKKNNSRL